MKLTSLIPLLLLTGSASAASTNGYTFSVSTATISETTPFLEFTLRAYVPQPEFKFFIRPWLNTASYVYPSDYKIQWNKNGAWTDLPATSLSMWNVPYSTTSPYSSGLTKSFRLVPINDTIKELPEKVTFYCVNGNFPAAETSMVITINSNE